MKKAVALIIAIIFGCSVVLAASSRLYSHSIIYDEEVKEGTYNEFYVTTEWQWEREDPEPTPEPTPCYEEPVIIEEPDYKNQKELDDLMVTVFVPELGIVAMSLPYDQEDNDPVPNRISLDLEDAEPGEYVARITVENDYTKRVKHRIFVIE